MDTEPAIDIATHSHPAWSGALLALCLSCSAAGAAAPPASPAPLETRLNEQVLMIPAGPGQGDALETTLFRPDGPGPFPLLVINHGKQAGKPQLQRRERFIFMATAFVRRGYAVLVPMRRGFSRSSGQYPDYGCDMLSNGYAQADDVLAALAYARRQSWVDRERIVVAGQSYGGLATMALATRAPPGVRGVLNFAGGLRVDDNSCDWQGALVRAFADYGAHGRVPSLWLYGANDSYFGPQLAARMFGAYVQAGGQGSLFAYGSFKRDAHGMLGNRDGAQVWLPAAERFLQRIGMPTREVVALPEPPAPQRSDYATLDNVEALPFLREAGRAAYRAFLAMVTPRAFALSASGAWGWAEDGEDPDARALAACQSKSRQPCQLYSVDDAVVWREGAPAAGAQAGASAATVAPAGTGATE